MKNKVTIRDVRYSELGEVYKLMGEIRPVELPPYRKWSNKIISGYRPIIRVAVDGSAIQGIAIYDIIPSYTGDLYTWLYCLAVKPENRKQGVGKALMEHVRKESKKRKAETINFICRKKNKAVGFYKRLGIVPDSTWYEMEWEV